MSTVPWLEQDPSLFPPLEHALDEPEGLLAVGGDLSPERLLNAYQHGCFPWYEDPQPILWWSPDPRCVIRPVDIHISKSLHKRLRKGDYEISFDRDFDAVIHHCATARGRSDGTWITPAMDEAYRALHRLGHAHSLEVWQNEELIGGLYGIAIGKVFCGESMFSLARDASKIALVHLAGQLQAWDFELIDCQVSNPHLLSLGAEEWARDYFAERLDSASKKAGPTPGPWQLDWRYQRPD